MKQNVYQDIITTAESLIQTRGYHAFSYKDIAQEVGVKTSSIHYHFPTKADLACAVVQYHIQGLNEQLDNLLADPKRNAADKLSTFFETVFAATVHNNNRMCLGGMLAIDTQTLPEVIQKEVRQFFSQLESWLTSLLNEGYKNKEFITRGATKSEAQYVLTVLEGALLMARLYNDPERLTNAKQQVMAYFGVDIAK